MQKPKKGGKWPTRRHFCPPLNSVHWEVLTNFLPWSRFYVLISYDEWIVCLFCFRTCCLFVFAPLTRGTFGTKERNATGSGLFPPNLWRIRLLGCDLSVLAPLSTACNCPRKYFGWSHWWGWDGSCRTVVASFCWAIQNLCQTRWWSLVWAVLVFQTVKGAKELKLPTMCLTEM